MDVDFATFTEDMSSLITIHALGSDALCIEEVRVNGAVAANVPAWLDKPCTAATYDSIACSESWVGAVDLIHPTWPVDFTFTTCDYENSASDGEFSLYFPTQDLFTTLSFTPTLGETQEMTMYFRQFEVEEDMEMVALSRDGWCLSGLSIEGNVVADENVWLDSPCVSNSEHVCASAVTYSFALPFENEVSVAPGTACHEWVLGYSAESCSETCSRISKTCVLADIEGITSAEMFAAMVANATELGTGGASLSSAEEFCEGGINKWAFASAPAAMRTPVYNSETQSTNLAFSCFYPTIMTGDCETKFNNPQSQRFCACDATECDL
eukprot:CAMPEP_0181288590 /NCGR_PEP_ID=MMETSP1101-20121128/416_1 /TAXON_ID=46948 /ORGANISM="Rhodomonas abbreviata, Strain Caron Lab Isolate" /LENGTH=324 /DNA_ID=CAMNT_0023392727 /DNA_START=303 /DNA_END=1277 /DNA_ORIENTATION=+